MITINRDVCIKCLKCVKVCPALVLVDKSGAPEIEPVIDCFNCMHCGAACPVGAISAADGAAVTEDSVMAVTEGFSKELTAYLKTRRSYRNFKAEPVAEDLLKAAVEVASFAPSAKNQHPTDFIIIQGKEKIQWMMDEILKFVAETGVAPEVAALYEKGKNLVMGNAETLILGHSRVKAINPTVDTALALYSAELYLQTKGVGTCWAGYLTRMCNTIPSLKELLQLPEEHQVYAALLAGYPEEEEYVHVPARTTVGALRWIK